MLTKLCKTPFPWFGGKADAAEHVWAALGDVPHYVEPFAGGLAVLLRRPHTANRTYHSETVNDLDGLLVNAWRSIQRYPEETAEAASWPVTEADVMARHLALLKWRSERNLELLMADPEWCDPKMGGWWLYGQSAWIGSGWCSGRGTWTVGDDGRIEKRGGSGVSRQLPHLGHDGNGVHRPQAREEGVIRQLPHLGNNGKGVHRPQAREEGVGPEPEYHPMTMPELRRWMRFLSVRLRHVRILNGDWTRAVTSGAAVNLPVRQGHGPVGVFVDPPYADTADRAEVYSQEDFQVAHAVREWCLSVGDDPRYRVVLAGFDGEHGEALIKAGWREIEWFRSGFLKGGMGNVGGKHQQARERLWLSPHCVQSAGPSQGSLFGSRCVSP